jgi:hypothetical protein
MHKHVHVYIGVLLNWERKTKRNEMKRNETKYNETKWKMKKLNETKRNEVGRHIIDHLQEELYLSLFSVYIALWRSTALAIIYNVVGRQRNLGLRLAGFFISFYLRAAQFSSIYCYTNEINCYTSSNLKQVIADHKPRWRK